MVESIMESVAQPWVSGLTFKQQSVLFSALRGCDGSTKEDLSKPLLRATRAVILKSAEAKHMSTTSLFMNGSIDASTVEKFAEDLDHYYVHFIMHLIHAIEIIGYKHPDESIRMQFLRAYYRLVEALHLLPETEAHLDIRLADKPYTEDEKTKYREIIIDRYIAPISVPEFKTAWQEVTNWLSKFRPKRQPILPQTHVDIPMPPVMPPKAKNTLLGTESEEERRRRKAGYVEPPKITPYHGYPR